MNRKSLSYFLTFVSGGGVGALISAFILNKKCNQKINEEVDKLNQLFNLKNEGYPLKDTKVTEQAFKNHESAWLKANPNIGKTVTYETCSENEESIFINPYSKKRPSSAINYTSFSNVSDTSEETIDDSDEQQVSLLDDESYKKNHPYQISFEEFYEDEPNYANVSLYYYITDNVLCEENEEVISDPDTLIGEEALSNLVKEGTSWVRNDRLEIDYEIIAIDRSYTEEVHGIVLNPRERYERKKNREDNYEG